VTDAALLLAEIQWLVERLDEDEFVDPERMRDVATGARDIASTLEMAQGRELAAAMRRLSQAAEGWKERAAQRLKDLVQGRRALRSYGGLRSHKQGQRIRKKA